MRTLHIGFLVWIAFCLSAFDCAADESRTVVILDATAQMSAHLGQKRKLDWAKSSISAAAGRMDPASSFALWAFGTNPQKKCEDTGELVSLRSANGVSGAVDKALGALQPKAARAPAMGTLQAALKSLGTPDGKPVSAVIIAGTGDDCIGDICSVAGQLHSTFPNAKLTVLGIGMSEQAAANFACAAKAMGGAFVGVKSGTDLDRNLRQALSITQASAQPKAAPPPAATADASQTAATNATDRTAATDAHLPAPKEQPTPQETEEKPAPAPQPEPNVVLSAVLSPKQSPLESGVTWEIYKINVTPTGQLRPAEAPLWVGGGGQAKVKLPEGRYDVKLTYGYATARSEFTLGADKVEKTVPLDAGTIAVEALQARDGPPAANAFFVLYKQKTAAAREELGRSSESPAQFHVNAGDYALSAFAGPAKLDTSVRVEAGKISVVRMALNVGTLEIKTFAVEGSSTPVAAWHQVSPGEPGKGAIPAMRIFGSSHSVQLPAGSYRLESIYGNARQESLVSIKAGQVTSQNVILNAGEAKVSLPSGKSEQVCAVYEAGADRNADPIGRAAGPDMHFILKAGRYDLECQKKGETAPSKKTEIKVVAGEVQSAKIED